MNPRLNALLAPPINNNFLFNNIPKINGFNALPQNSFMNPIMPLNNNAMTNLNLGGTFNNGLYSPYSVESYEPDQTPNYLNRTNNIMNYGTSTNIYNQYKTNPYMNINTSYYLPNNFVNNNLMNLTLNNYTSFNNNAMKRMQSTANILYPNQRTEILRNSRFQNKNAFYTPRKNVMDTTTSYNNMGPSRNAQRSNSMFNLGPRTINASSTMPGVNTFSGFQNNLLINNKLINNNCIYGGFLYKIKNFFKKI